MSSFVPPDDFFRLMKISAGGTLPDDIGRTAELEFTKMDPQRRRAILGTIDVQLQQPNQPASALRGQSKIFSLRRRLGARDEALRKFGR
jgi:hypothetical protein